MTRIIHISDLHIGPLKGFTPRHWNLKRALGYINWQKKRRHLHTSSALACLHQEIIKQNPDHCIITGDLINLGLPGEFELASQWLAEFGGPEAVSLVPGNHDIYTTLWSDPGVSRWGPYMTSDAWGAQHTDPNAAFPYVRRCADICIIGLNSAIPTPPGLATGLVGWRQSREVDKLLDVFGNQGLFRLVLIHHPPLSGLTGIHRRLRDVVEIEDILAHRGAELVVYGHNHRNQVTWLSSGHSQIPVIGIGSASMSRQYHEEDTARYNLYDIQRSAQGWVIEMLGRGLESPEGPGYRCRTQDTQGVRDT